MERIGAAKHFGTFHPYPPSHTLSSSPVMAIWPMHVESAERLDGEVMPATRPVSLPSEQAVRHRRSSSSLPAEVALLPVNTMNLPRLNSGDRQRGLRCSAFTFWLLLFILANPSAIQASVGLEEAEAARIELRRQLIELKNAASEHPRDAEIQTQLGISQLRLGALPSAITTLELAQRLGAERGAWIAELATAYLQSGQYQKLTEQVEPLASDPAELRAVLFGLLGRAKLGLNQRAAGEQLLQQALQLEPNEPNAHIGLGVLALADQAWEEAERLARRATSLAPDSPAAWSLLGQVTRSRRPERSLAAFRQVLVLRPGSRSALQGQISALLDLERIEEAEALLPALESADDSGVVSGFTAARIAYSKNQLDRAKQRLRGVLTEAEHRHSRLLLGFIELKQGRAADALEHLRLALETDPTDIEARVLLAATHLELSEPLQAIELLATVDEQSLSSRALGVLGRAHMALKEPDEALQRFHQALELTPEAAELHAQVALSHLAQGNRGQAVEHLESWRDEQDPIAATMFLVYLFLSSNELELAQSSAQRLLEHEGAAERADVHNLIGAVWMAAGDPVRARLAFDDAAGIDPALTAVALNQAQLARLGGRIDDAIAHYRRILAREADPTALAELAQLLADQGDLQEARKLAQRAWNSVRLTEAGIQLARLELRAGFIPQAIDLLEEVLERDPDDTEALTLLSATQLKGGRNREAGITVARLTRLLPNLAAGWEMLAEVQRRAGELNAARRSLQHAIDLEPSQPRRYMRLAQLQLESRDWLAVDEVVETLRRIAPERPLADRLQAELLLRQGNTRAALAPLERAHAQEPSRTSASTLSRLRRGLGDLPGAIEVLEQWLAGHPEDVQNRRQLAIQLQRAGQLAKAEQQYRQLLATVPDDIATLNNLAWLYAEQSDRRALALAERAVELAPQRADVIDTLGWIHVRLGQPREGLRWLKQAALTAPTHPEIRYHLAVAYAESGQPEAALDELERLLFRNRRPFADQAAAEALRQQLKARLE